MKYIIINVLTMGLFLFLFVSLFTNPVKTDIGADCWNKAGSMCVHQKLPSGGGIDMCAEGGPLSCLQGDIIILEPR